MRISFLGLVHQLLNFLLGPSMKQLPRIGEFSLRGKTILHRLNMKNRYVKIVDVSPLLVSSVHNVLLDVVKRASLVQLEDGVLGGIA